MPVSQPPPSWDKILNKPTTVAGFGISDMASQTCGAVPFSGVTGKPTTLSGYGITDEKCKAWVNFNGTGTVAIRSSFNVSSITDNGVGDYTVNFTNAMPDTNYAAIVSAQAESNGTNWTFPSLYASGTPLTTNSARITMSPSGAGGGGNVDGDYICVSIFR